MSVPFDLNNANRPKIVIQPRCVERAARLQRKSLASLARAAPSSITANPIERSAIRSVDDQIAKEPLKETTPGYAEQAAGISGDIRGSGQWHKVVSASPLSSPPITTISRNSDQSPSRDQPPCVECSKRDPSAPKCNFCKLLCLMDKFCDLVDKLERACASPR
ncbi:hypothetical protein EYR38_006372 [Pleurotus pulmonarius]|nr:hypothetical protein EYR38_006372 [Pleurotus pulmonarius]